MFDPDSDDASRLRLAESGVDRDAKIEQLLFAGLDHYFNAQYEQAMDVWTRVLFLDRGHARAGAYIERASAALGERQREADELVHTGVAAFNRGDVGEAQERLTSALERGGEHAEALVLLDRLRLLEASGGSAGQRETGPYRSAAAEGRSSTDAGRAHLADRTVVRRRGGRRLWVVGPIGSCPAPESGPASGRCRAQPGGATGGTGRFGVGVVSCPGAL